MYGDFGASLFQLLVGYSVEKQHSCTVPFVYAGLPRFSRRGASLPQGG